MYELNQERQFTHVVTLSEKLEMLKGMDDPSFINEVIDADATILAKWMVKHKDALEAIKNEPEAWKKKFLIDSLIVVHGNDIKGVNERIVENKLLNDLLTKKDSSKTYLETCEHRLDLVNRIKRIPIESLVTLNKQRTTASRISGSCPFSHVDRRPSFTIFKTENRFKCFSCGRRGDTIEFWMELHKCSFNEAIEALGRIG